MSLARWLDIEQLFLDETARLQKLEMAARRLRQAN